MSQSGRDQGQYRIHAVAEMTGVPAATLRAWERRYGIPSPERTTSAYRLYSDDDVELVRRLRDLCARGLAPAEAARMLKAPAERPQSPPPADPAEGEAFSAAIRRIELAAEAFDAQAVEAEVRNALFLGSAATVFDRVIAPAQVRIGDRWHQGTMSVGQEHLVSEVLVSTARDLLRLLQPDGSGRTALLACFGHEEHVLPLLGAAFRFTSWGFRVVNLGARTPPWALKDAVVGVRPDVVALSCTVPPAPEEAEAVVLAYAEACGDVPWVVGGRAADELGPLVTRAGGLVASADDPAAVRRHLQVAMASRGMAAEE